MENVGDSEAVDLAIKRANFLLLSVRFKYQMDKVLPAIREALECKQSDSATTNPPAK